MIRWVSGGMVLLSVCMMVAALGRAWDWSPFALVVCGAILGFSVGVALTVMVYESDDPDVDPDVCGAANPILARSLACELPPAHKGSHRGESASGMFYVWPDA